MAQERVTSEHLGLNCVAVKLMFFFLQMERKNLLEEVEKEEQALLRLRIAYRIQPLEQDLGTSAH